MTRVIIPAIVMMINVGGSVGPDGPVTGKVAISTIFIGVISYAGCRIGDWLSDWFAARSLR